MTPKQKDGWAKAKSYLEEKIQLSDRASKKKNLELLWQVLEGIRNDGLNNYSLAMVGRRLKPLGGMGVQSLRNSSGIDYQRLIELYEQAFQREPEKSTNKLESALALLSDSSVRAAIKAKLDRAEHLERENDRLIMALKSRSIGFAPDARGAPPAPQLNESQAVLDPARLTSRLVAALAKGMDEARLKERGLTVRPDGSITNSGGAVLFPPGFAEAIGRVLPPAKT
jgi:tetratricopeptide (TPR) repeat protein